MTPKAADMLGGAALVCALAALGGCGRKEAPAPFAVHRVGTLDAGLPHRVETRGDAGFRALPPAVWNASKKRFLGEQTYRIAVRPGDTVYGLARSFAVPTTTLIRDNNLEPPYTLTPGTHLVIHNPHIHMVRAGEHLRGIADLHGVDIYALARRNNLAPDATLEAGQSLYLPAEAARTIPSPNQRTKADKKAEPAGTMPAGKAPRFRRPVKGRVIAKFGPYGQGLFNDGVDFAVPAGTPVIAAADGQVVYTGNHIPSYGNLVLVKHGPGWITAYAHLQRVDVQKDAHIKGGSPLGLAGKTGDADVPKLHFEIRKNGKPQDPLTQL